MWTTSELHAMFAWAKLFYFVLMHGVVQEEGISFFYGSLGCCLHSRVHLFRTALW